MKDLSIITVTWNAKEFIADQVRSAVLGCQKISFEQIVVDNASTDGTQALIREQFPQVTLIENTTNAGFAAANNRAIPHAQGRFFLFLNPDMRVEPGTLDTLIAWMDTHPKVGIASCRLVDGEGKDNPDASPRRFPTLRDQLPLILKLHYIVITILDRYLMRDFDPSKEQAVDSVRGSFMLVRRELIEKLGWAFDPRYFIWFEDVDTCREAKRLGYTVMYVPIVRAVDYVGQSFKKHHTVWKQKQFTKSMLQYFQKWHPWFIWIWIWLARPIGIFLVWRGQIYLDKKLVSANQFDPPHLRS